MIRYPKRNFWEALFYWWGGINRSILPTGIHYLAFLLVVWRIQLHLDIYLDVSADYVKTLGGFVSFLLVFRLNQSMSRWKQGEEIVALLFAKLDHTMGVCIVHLRGAMDLAEDQINSDLGREYHELALVIKVNAVRLSLAFGISFVMHCRMMEAACESLGELEEISVKQLLFLYRRLQGLLYEEEMEIIDQAIYCSQRESVYRIMINRHGAKAEGEMLLGSFPDDNPNGKTSVSLPDVTMALLRRTFSAPLSKPWGYPERLLNTFSSATQSLMENVAELDVIMSQPLPLAYLQHCRTVLIIFALVYPLSVDPHSGIMDNIAMPFFILWALLGFERLAELTENPLGHDETDINMFENLHASEAHARYFFDMSEVAGANLDIALWRPLQDFFPTPKTGQDTYSTTALRYVVYDLEVYPFDKFFKWMPLPNLMFESLLHGHGQVWNLHMVNFGLMCQSVKDFLCCNFVRARHRPSGTEYIRVSTDENPQWIGDEGQPFVHNAVEKDPYTIDYYVVFNGVRKSEASSTRQSAWVHRAREVLDLESCRPLLYEMPSCSSARPTSAASSTSIKQDRNRTGVEREFPTRGMVGSKPSRSSPRARPESTTATATYFNCGPRPLSDPGDCPDRPPDRTSNVSAAMVKPLVVPSP